METWVGVVGGSDWALGAVRRDLGPRESAPTWFGEGFELELDGGGVIHVEVPSGALRTGRYTTEIVDLGVGRAVVEPASPDALGRAGGEAVGLRGGDRVRVVGGVTERAASEARGYRSVDAGEACRVRAARVECLSPCAVPLGVLHHAAPSGDETMGGRRWDYALLAIVGLHLLGSIPGPLGADLHVVVAQSAWLALGLAVAVVLWWRRVGVARVEAPLLALPLPSFHEVRRERRHRLGVSSVLGVVGVGWLAVGVAPSCVFALLELRVRHGLSMEPVATTPLIVVAVAYWIAAVTLALYAARLGRGDREAVTRLLAPPSDVARVLEGSFVGVAGVPRFDWLVRTATRRRGTAPALDAVISYRGPDRLRVEVDGDEHEVLTSGAWLAMDGWTRRPGAEPDEERWVLTPARPDRGRWFVLAAGRWEESSSVRRFRANTLFVGAEPPRRWLARRRAARWLPWIGPLAGTSMMLAHWLLGG